MAIKKRNEKLNSKLKHFFMGGGGGRVTMAKILKVADGAFFVPSYSDQTIVCGYPTQTTIQSFGYGDDAEEPKDKDYKAQDQKPRLAA
jgi:hypothetical protein